jgi:integrase/recombinase XerD
LPVDKSGRVYVVGSVPVLHPEAQTVDEMLEGWRYQQLSRNLDHDTIAGRVRLVERFIEHTNEFPWTRTPAMVEEFFSDLRSVKRRKAVDGAALPECVADVLLVCQRSRLRLGSSM